MGLDTEVAIVGSGPNGLSVAAHLRALGVDCRIFGPPMKFWRDMPRGINLKSFAYATNVYVPRAQSRGTSFPEWSRARGLEDFEPCTMESFANYGLWMAERFVPGLEPTEVTGVSASPGGGFLVSLGNGESLRAGRVVCATGLSHLANMPEPLRGLPEGLAIHTAELSDYSRFRGRNVAVLGAGASAIEAGALIHEAGGTAQILVREREVVFHTRLDVRRSLYERLRKPLSVIGPGKKNRLFEEFPFALYFVPRSRRVPFVKKYLGAAAPWWITDRVQGVPISLRTSVVAAEPRGSGVRLQLREGDRSRVLDVDHVIAGTGFVSDLDRLVYLEDSLRARIRRLEQAPDVSMYFESSVRGLYFMGPIVTLSFGPVFRFVCGAKYAAPTIAQHIAGPIRTLKAAASVAWSANRAPQAS
jgi:pyruvate/2-oxoglutarate dehydrogenase complex dihydrolipoamide dehydrogenase (E3) component